MNANELRIGNIILVTAMTNRYNNETKVIIVDSHQFELCEKYPEKHNPIPLTEEWLLKFDCKKIWVFEIFGDNKRGFHISTEYGEWIFLKYVHQLQNLYFALTGEELTQV